MREEQPSAQVVSIRLDQQEASLVSLALRKKNAATATSQTIHTFLITSAIHEAKTVLDSTQHAASQKSIQQTRPYSFRTSSSECNLPHREG
ncbi:hypothetical protein AC781_04450 [Akkermansia glycaniphila]|nr:hypothetical protein AC781_04450 [Akkermansia glycaniphila]